ncbi:MAG: cytochrome b/b6 domain-containing protein [Rhizobiaceae bacterium]|nr:cytochrome b/b6 domain-containing protein [Rhizobiaceae bacterium]
MEAPAGYTRSQIVLHWLIAALVAFQFLASDGIEAAWRAFIRTQVVGDAFSALALAHIVVGITILLLVGARLWLRLKHGAPAPDPAEPRVLQWLAKLAHFALYVVLIILPLSGLVGWVFGQSQPIEVHQIAKTILLVLVGLHLLGVLFHQFIWKTGVLRRMFVPVK